jgi:K+-sensing histidine kinase KdpD
MTKLMLWRPRSLVVAKYGNAILAVGAVVILTQWMETLLPSTPQVSLLLCAVMVSAWFGGFGPGLVAVVLSSGAFAFFFRAVR